MKEQSAYTVKYHPNNHELEVAGSLRPRGEQALAPLFASLAEAMEDVTGVLYLNLKRLRQLNHTGVVHLARMIRGITVARSNLHVKLVVSSAIPWAVPRFEQLAALWPNVSLEQYNRAFYPGQRVIDSDEFIPVLRTQNELLWRLERDHLAASGLKTGMRVADICCGIGDFALLVRKAFNPEVVIAVDHSRRFLDYANSVRDEFRLDRVEYRFGDATHLLLPDASFDFVMCRMSLQVFDQPEQIVRELYRICRPGGRVYITNELMSHNLGYPHRESIEAGYRAFMVICRRLGLDIEFGPKAAVYLKDEGFEDVTIDAVQFNNTNSDPDDFVKVVESWIHYVTHSMGPATNSSPEEVDQVRSGLEDFIGAIRHRRGYASWPIYTTTARRPEY